MDPESIRSAVRERYTSVARTAEGQFPYPTGRVGAERLGYADGLVESAPAGMLDSFCGVGNPLSLGEAEKGWSVLDIGCGAGLDLFAAARAVGASGRVCGIDMTPAMVVAAQDHLDGRIACDLQVREASCESIPWEDGSFDLVISNGVLNLAPDKPACFAEIARVLRAGGRLQLADIVLRGDLPPGEASSPEAWSR